MVNVLVISDLHIPAEHPDALEFCIEVGKKNKCKQVVFLGDIFDLHRASFHDHDPAMPSLVDELNLCKDKIKAWVKAFPKAKICEGNHDIRLNRIAQKAGLPANVLKNINEIFELPATWEWADNHFIDGVKYTHGLDCKLGSNGQYASVMKHRCSVVYGHAHSFAGVVYSATKKDLLFGFNAGWLGDENHLAIRYAKTFVNRGVVGCGVVLNDGQLPIFMPMPI